MDRRTRYLDAASRLFSQHGFVGTTMNMLIEEVGGSKATLYKAFPSKEALVQGLIDRVALTISRDMADPRDNPAPLPEALHAIGAAALAGVTSPQAVGLLRLCLGEYSRFPELARTVWEHGPAVTYANFHAFIAERERRGELAVPNPQFAAEQFIAGIVGHLQPKVAMGIAQPPDAAEAEARVASAVKTFVARYGTGAG